MAKATIITSGPTVSKPKDVHGMHREADKVASTSVMPAKKC